MAEETSHVDEFVKSLDDMEFLYLKQIMQSQDAYKRCEAIGKGAIKGGAKDKKKPSPATDDDAPLDKVYNDEGDAESEED